MIQIKACRDLMPLNQLAKYHWDSINPKIKNGNYHQTHSLIGRIKRIRDLHRNENNARQYFYNNLLKNNNRLLKRIVLAKAYEFPKIIRRVTALLLRYELLPITQNFKDEINEQVFQYNNWRSNGKAGQLFEQLGITICPYCNIGDVFHDKINDILVCDFDHYYNQASYPYLSLSIFNLIPTCKTCNETYKGQLPFGLPTHIHPYTDNYNERAQFQSNYSEGSNDYEISIIQNHDRTVNFSHDLGIYQRYNQQTAKSTAKAIYYSAIQSVGQKDLLSQVFNFTLEEAEKWICNQSIIPYEDKDILNTPLGKLKRDLAVKYNLLTNG